MRIVDDSLKQPWALSERYCLEFVLSSLFWLVSLLAWRSQGCGYGFCLWLIVRIRLVFHCTSPNLERGKKVAPGFLYWEHKPTFTVALLITQVTGLSNASIPHSTHWVRPGWREGVSGCPLPTAGSRCMRGMVASLWPAAFLQAWEMIWSCFLPHSCRDPGEARQPLRGVFCVAKDA